MRWVWVAFLAACGDGAMVPGDAICSESPPLSSCVAGQLFADCGGTGEPRFACRDRGCLWFTGGCVAEGFVSSPCDADQLCCLDSWPYARGTDFQVQEGVFGFLWAYGVQPWTRERARAVEVVVDAQLAHGSGTFTCDGADPFGADVSPCTSSIAAAQPIVAADLPHFLLSELTVSAFGFWNLRVEIDPEVQPIKARVCAESFTDGQPFVCPTRPTAPVCATSGTIALSKFPWTETEREAVAGRIDVQLGSLHLTGSF